MTDVLSWIRLSGPFLIGHRGAPRAARENTLASFEAALEAGCDGVELDVRATQDGVLVVHHDETLDGEKGKVSIAGTPWSEINRRFFRGKEGMYPIHGLEEVLETLSGRCLINVEVKPPGSDHRVTVASALIEALERVRPRESVLVSSFDPEMLRMIGWKDKSTLLGFLFSAIAEFNHLEENEIVGGLSAIHPKHDLVNKTLMKRAGERGLAVHAWTVDDPARTRELLGLGVTSVITNRPELCGRALFS